MQVFSLVFSFPHFLLHLALCSCELDEGVFELLECVLNVHFSVTGLAVEVGTTLIESTGLPPLCF